MTSYIIFKTAAIEPKIYFRVEVSDGILLSRRKSIRMSNFDKVSHSTAEIKLLPVSEIEHLPY